MYIIAQKLVWKSNEDGYLVVSVVPWFFICENHVGYYRGQSVKKHYSCQKCHYSDFDSKRGISPYAGRSGCDMPDKNCPVSGSTADERTDLISHLGNLLGI